ncbi:MAG TPA: hypothetical protein VLT33_22080 [Labilithrix sp.]|nr:hypothetical protein [Labilithrix sp.]
MRPTFVAAIAAASSLLCAAPCLADDRVVDASRRGLTGFELTLRPGFGGAPSDSPLRLAPGATLPGGSSLLSGAAPYGPGLVVNGSVGYRFHPLLSTGLRLGIRQASDASLAGARLVRSAFDVGVYFRAYPLATTPSIARHLDPWVSLGVGYMRDNQAIHQGNRLEGLDHVAVGVPLGIGIDWRVLTNLSVGPSFEYALALGGSGCQTVLTNGAQTSQTCTGDASNVLEARTYGVWSTGLDMRLTF